MQTIHVSADFPLNRRMRKAVQRGKLHVVRDGGERSGLGGGSQPTTTNPNAGMEYVAQKLGRLGITATPFNPKNRILSIRRADGAEIRVCVKSHRTCGRAIKLHREGEEVHYDFLVILTNFHGGLADVYVLTLEEVKNIQHKEPRAAERYVLRARDYGVFQSANEEWEKIAQAAR